MHSSDSRRDRAGETDGDGVGGLDTEALSATAWHALGIEQAAQRLGSDAQGLSGDEARRRRERFGPNRLPEEGRTGLLRVFLRQFRSPLIYILLVAGLVSLGIGAYADAAFIFAVLLLNSVIGTIQESKAESSAHALKAVIKVRARVRRDGKEQGVDATELVPGDCVLIEAGDAVPADLRLLEAQDLRSDESLLTGESMPVEKAAAEGLDEDTGLGDRRNLLHAGTQVLDGRALGLVCRTGSTTEVGRIAHSLEHEAAAEPPLVIRLRHLTQLIAYVVMGAVVLLVFGQLLRGAEPVQIFFFAVALAVSAIPAGLPVAITVALSLATHRMAQRNVIVRRLPAVEGLGACTLIASDKTGTLTANELTAKRLVLPDLNSLEVEGEGLTIEGRLLYGDEPAGDEMRADAEALARSAVLCNEGELRRDDDEVEASGDTVDVAFLVLGAKLGLARDELVAEHPEAGRIPFKAQNRLAAAFHRDGERTVAHVKGAAEAVLPRCEGIDQEAIEDALEEMSGAGYRVLAVAAGAVSADVVEAAEVDRLEGLTLLGLAGLIDPLRPEVPEAVGRCAAAGVSVRMVTGDHPATGLSIARRLGIAEEGDEAFSGADLKGSDDDTRRRVARAAVFARVEPEQKTTIVESLQRSGHYVAVTGDGVNDAPALRAANIGVAMGKAGTDVARGAADLILTDDNFASIVNGIEEGRVAYANVRKVTWLLISTGAAEIVLFFLAFATKLPLPLDAVQLLWLNLVTNGIQDVAMAFEKGEPGVLDRPPRPTDQPIFDRRMIEQTLVSGAFMGAVAFAVFHGLHVVWGWSEFDARNALLLLMVLFENVHIFNCRSEERSAFRVPIRANLLLVGTVAAAQGVHLLAMYLPGLSGVLETAPVSALQWLALLAVALSLLLVMELFKQLRGPALERREVAAAESAQG